jgi:ABC-type branched-subunit amino acid transport system permease subunit
VSYYLSTIAVFFGIDLLAAWALNMQFGWAGVPNFAFIVFQAVGAYIAAVLTLGPNTGITAYQHYILGANLPFPVPLFAAAAAGALLALVMGLVTLRRMRRDYQATVLLLIALIASEIVSGDVSLFNGSNGLAGIPQPFAGRLAPAFSTTYQWIYAGFVAVICVIVMAFVRRLERSGWQRGLRALRDHEPAATALGLSAVTMRLEVFVVGGAIAGLSGGLLVQYLSAWSPSAWGYVETFGILTGIILGGVSNDWGVLLGTFLVQIVFVEVPSFLPQIGYPGLIDSLEWVLIGFLWIIVLLVRPSGILPERRRKARRAPGEA